MINTRFKKITSEERMNLCGVFEDYFDWFCKEHKLDDKGIENAAHIYNEVICPGVDQSIPAVNYTDIFAVNLRNLFRKIRKKERISKEKFREEIRPLITEPLERYLMEQYHEEDPLWGIWYKAEDFPGGASACEAEVESSCDNIYNLSAREVQLLKPHLLREDMPGEVTAYALMMFTGASAEDLSKVTYSDIYPLYENGRDSEIHYRGSFPKMRRMTDRDIRPRFVPLPGKIEELLRHHRNMINTKMSAGFTNNESYTGPGPLPIACHGKSYTERCTMHAVSTAANSLLRDVLHFSELRMALINRSLLENMGIYSTELAGALYIARRRYELTLFLSGMDEPMMQYLTGCEITDARYIDAPFADPDRMMEAKDMIEQVLQL